MCLKLLEEAVRPGCQVLDLGCGSGILAIAALGLGAAHAIGVDIDPKAVDVAYENAAMNGIGPDRLTVYAGNVLGDAKLAAKLRPGQNRVVLANIVADVIIPRADEVAAAIQANGLAITRRLERSGWCAFSAQRR